MKAKISRPLFSKCVPRSLCSTMVNPATSPFYLRRMTRGHPFGHFMNILYCEASRSTTCAKTHMCAHACAHMQACTQAERPAHNSKGEPHEVRRRGLTTYSPPYFCASPRRGQQGNKRPSNMRRLRTLPTGNPPPVLPDPSRSLRIGVPTI
jgi:hypothetical protein